MRAVLAFDLGTTTGWAGTDSSGLVQSGFVLLKRPKDSDGKRMLRFSTLVRDLIELVSPDLVAYEEVRAHSGVIASHVYGGLQGILLAECERSKIPCHGIPVGTIKKFGTGRGDADKTLMIMAAKAKWADQDVSDDNHSDALWVMETAIHTL